MEKNKLIIKTDFDDLYNFFYKNKDKFKKIANGERETNKHLDSFNKIKKKYKIEFPYGKCFPISQFLFYYLGGYGSGYKLMVIKKIKINLENDYIYTSHWFLKSEFNNVIIDLTKSQFDKILNIEDYYKKAVRANYGFPYFKKNGKVFENTVPCKQVLQLYEEFRKNKINGTLEYYYNWYKKETDV